MYSLLVNQYSLSRPAYNFWEKMRMNSQDQGGLYESQPVQITGNLHNLSDPSTSILGFFGASGKTSKRIFVSEVEGLPYLYVDCLPVVWPVIANPECKECTAVPGSKNVKPGYWPK
jgi:hypothetical protein